MPGKNRKPQLLTACIVAAAAWCIIIGRLLAFVCLQHSLLSVSNSTARSRTPILSAHPQLFSTTKIHIQKKKIVLVPSHFFSSIPSSFPCSPSKLFQFHFQASSLSISLSLYIYMTHLSTIFFSGPDDELRFNQCGKKKHYKLFLSLIIKTGKGTSYATHNCNAKREIRHQNRRRRRETQRRKQKGRVQSATQRPMPANNKQDEKDGK